MQRLSGSIIKTDPLAKFVKFAKIRVISAHYEVVSVNRLP